MESDSLGGLGDLAKYSPAVCLCSVTKLCPAVEGRKPEEQ